MPIAGKEPDDLPEPHQFWEKPIPKVDISRFCFVQSLTSKTRLFKNLPEHRSWHAAWLVAWELSRLTVVTAQPAEVITSKKPTENDV
jgi:hypothetical protein